MTSWQIIPFKLIDTEPSATTTSTSITTFCTCGCKEFDHRMGAKKRGACRMCIRCKKFKLPKPIKSKIKKA